MKIVHCAIAILAFGASVAAAAPRIPSSELPGRERDRFVDPPGARLLQPRESTVALPSAVEPRGSNCPSSGKGKRTRKGKRC
jgi:hypothetical protein